MVARAFWALRVRALTTVRLRVPRVLRDFKYTDHGEWVKVNGTSAIVGITDDTQEGLREVMHVDLPKVGAEVIKGEKCGDIWGTKIVHEANSPVSGSVVEINQNLSESPSLINTSTYEDGWIIKVEMSNVSEVNSLMDSEQYIKFYKETISVPGCKVEFVED